MIFIITSWLQWIHSLMNENNSDQNIPEVQQKRENYKERSTISETAMAAPFPFALKMKLCSRWASKIF